MDNALAIGHYRRTLECFDVWSSNARHRREVFTREAQDDDQTATTEDGDSQVTLAPAERLKMFNEQSVVMFLQHVHVFL